MHKLLVMAMMAASTAALACSDPHDYVETSRIRMVASVASVYSLTGPNSHLVNVSARFDNGHAIMLTLPGGGVERGHRLSLDKIVLEDRLENGEPLVKYDLVGVHAD